MDYLRALFNSTVLALTVAVLQAASCTVIGYGLARFEFFGNRLMFAMVIFTLLVPPQMVNIPLFLNFRTFDLFGVVENPINLIGTYWPFVLTSITGLGLKNGLFIYIMRQFLRHAEELGRSSPGGWSGTAARSLELCCRVPRFL